MVHHLVDDGAHLGVDTLNYARDGVGKTVTVFNDFEPQTAMAEEASRPGQRHDFSGIKISIDQIGEVFAGYSVAARQ